jgi:hypothetical protein
MGMFSMITEPSPKTSLSAGCGSTLPPPLIHFSNGAGFTGPPVFAAAITSQSPFPINRVDVGNALTWPTWSPW